MFNYIVNCLTFKLQVFQRRVDGTTDFYRGWTEYENGFGDLNSNFYMGSSLTTYYVQIVIFVRA